MVTAVRQDHVMARLGAAIEARHRADIQFPRQIIHEKTLAAIAETQSQDGNVPGAFPAFSIQ